MPTVCELAGVTETHSSDGISYAPTLLGRPPQKRHDHLYFEFHEGDGAQAVIKGKWKALVRGVKTDHSQPLELYDLESDPSEQMNVAKENAAVAKEMQNLIDKSHKPSALFKLPSDKVLHKQ